MKDRGKRPQTGTPSPKVVDLSKVRERKARETALKRIREEAKEIDW